MHACILSSSVCSYSEIPMDFPIGTAVLNYTFFDLYNGFVTSIIINQYHHSLPAVHAGCFFALGQFGRVTVTHVMYVGDLRALGLWSCSPYSTRLGHNNGLPARARLIETVVSMAIGIVTMAESG